jgi:serine/threonine-protein kinase
MSQSATDRNLLFGILALQLDFIDQGALIAAMHAWVLDKAKPLGQILHDQGALAAEREALLDALVQEHLRGHGGDAQRSLAALRSVPNLAHTLEQVADREVQSSLGHVSTTPHGPAALATGPYVLPATLPPHARFRVLRPHARGGLGEVFVARDEELNREVALKEIQQRHAHDPDSRSRFLREAEITGGLEHPGIVPVYGLGAYPDGRPFYAMRFIRGDNLQQAIRAFHETEGRARDPGERTLALRQLLGRFVAMCNAVAYAHSRGVLHRDLKPGNIMLGRYGETLLVDWGLARYVEPHDSDGAAESALRPSAATDAGSTQAGSAVGTPAYMSPEQAAGRLDLLGPASDVYSLGATLYTLLTGQPPFPRKDPAEILPRVQRGEFARPRQWKKDIPDPLQAICLKAMALHPADRYGSALELAADLEHWLADEPVSAWPEGLPARLARWARHHRPLVAGAAALLVTAVVSLAVSTVLIGLQRAKAEHARQEAVTNYREAQRQQERAKRSAVEASRQKVAAEHSAAEARTGKRLAEVQRRRAERNFKKARDAVDKMLTEVGDQRLAQVPMMEPVRRKLLEEALAFYQEFLKERSDDPEMRRETARAFQRVGDVYHLLGRTPEAERAYSDSLAMLEKLCVTWPDELPYQWDAAKGYHNRGLHLQNVGRFPEAEKSLQQALERFTKLVATSDGDPNARSNLALALHNVGVLMWRTSRPDEAEAAYRKALALYDELVAEFPAEANMVSGMANCCNSLGTLVERSRKRPAEAIKHYRRAIGLWRQLLTDPEAKREAQRSLAYTLANLAQMQMLRGQAVEANRAFNEGLEIQQKLATDFPTVPDYRNDLGRMLSAHGFCLAVLGRVKEAEQAYRRGIELQEKVVADFPLAPDYHFEVGNSVRNLAYRLRKAKEFAEASKLLEKTALHHAEALRLNPKHPLYRESLRNDYRFLAQTYLDLGKHAEAAARAAHLPQVMPEGWQEYYRAASYVARCIPLAEKDAALTLERRKELVGTYGEQAVRFLKEAAQRGFSNPRGLQEDSALSVLRSRRDFQELVEALAAKKP